LPLLVFISCDRWERVYVWPRGRKL